MITEDYVSLKTAKILLAKGFDQNCATYYLRGRIYRHHYTEVIPRGESIYAAPTQAVVMKWIRQRPKIAYNILIISDGDLGELNYSFEIQEIDNEFMQNNGSLDNIEDKRYESYEKALEAGIQYCLNNLIK